MKPFVALALVAVVLAVNQASAQINSPGVCPASQQTFGICVFDPKVNCLEDSECKGGQLCCPNGCNKICKDPENASKGQPPSYPGGVVIKQCPPASDSKNSFGICVFDKNVNCLSDGDCSSDKMCCAEGCNKVCKEPVTFQPVKPEPKGPAFETASSSPSKSKRSF